MDGMHPFTIMFLAIAALIVGLLAHYVYNVTRPTVTRKATVTGKRREKGMSTAKCTFEFDDGTRQEFDVSLGAYASLAPNDVGYLDTKGVVFWAFRPEHEAAPSVPPSTASNPANSHAEVEEALSRGQKMEAIRLYRARTGAGPVEAKAAVEQLEASLSADE